MSTASQYPLEEHFVVFISEDKLTASIQFTKHEESFACEASELEEGLRSYGVVSGINREQLQLIAASPAKYYSQNTIVASGTPPKHGEDGKIIQFHDWDEKDRTPSEAEDGKIDYREIIKLKNVKKGEMIAERRLATKGTPGMSVTGDELTARDGKDVYFKIGKNVVADAERIRLYATIDGLVTKTDRDKMNVFPIYEVNGDVDFNIGNIDFVGTVIVRGNVLTGFKVKAAGDIRIFGNVEGAELEAGGSIEVSAGIIANHKGFVKAGTTLKTSFILEGIAEAGEEIIVSQSIMHSRVKAGKAVICKGAKGLIVGGVIQAGERVVARTIGNTMSTATAIEVGVRPELRNEMTELRQQLRGLNENLLKTDQALQMLDQLASAGQLSGEKMAMRVRLAHTRKASNEEQIALKERILEIEKSLEDVDRARVDVIGTIYSGAKIVIGRYTRFIKDPTTRVSFQMHDGEITLVSTF